jgi:NitT/TauT family transport system ATP-binding protein
LVDEPFAALDEIKCQRLNADLLALWPAQRFTTLFVTQSVFGAACLTQRVTVMSLRPGRIVADIAVDALYPHADDWRRDGRYHALCRAASAALQAAPAGVAAGTTAAA